MKILGNFIPFESEYQFNETKINLNPLDYIRDSVSVEIV